MKIKKQIPRAVKNLLMMSKTPELFIYRPEYIEINFGPLKGKNLTELFIEDEDLVNNYLENILDHENCTYKLTVVISEVYSDLKKGYPRYEQ